MATVAKIGHSGTHIWTTIEITTKPQDDGVSLGLILPIVLIAVFLLIVATCLYWHSWRDKRNLGGNVGARSTFSLSRLSSNLTSGTEWTKEYRSSTRSNTPLRTSFKERARIQPIDWTHSSDGDAVRPTSYVKNIVQCSNLGAIDNPAFQPLAAKRLSPINETETSKHHVSSVPSACHSFATTNVAHQAPFSPYRTVWLNNEIEQNWERSSSLPNFPSSVSEHRTSINHNCTHSHLPKDSNSGYYPNHNTPTEPAEMSLNSTPLYGMNPAVITSAVCDIHKAPCEGVKHYTGDGSSATVYPESGNPSSSAGAAVVLQQSHQSDLSQNVSSSLSLPSSISQWHQRYIDNRDWENVKFGTVEVGGGPGGIQNPALASSIDSYTSSDNMSMQPNFGSSTNTSGVPRVPHVSSVASSANNSAFKRSVIQVPNNTATSSVNFQQTIYRSEDLTDKTSSLSNVNRSDCLIHGQMSDLPIVKPGSNHQIRRSFSITAQKNCSPSGVLQEADTTQTRSRPVSYPLPPAYILNAESHHVSLTLPNYVHHVMAPHLPPLLRHKQYWV